jgi:hypothetical protein
LKRVQRTGHHARKLPDLRGRLLKLTVVVPSDATGIALTFGGMPDRNLPMMLSAMETQLRASLQESRARFSHSGLRGGGVENSFRAFLDSHLPRNVSVGTGEVIDSNESRSGQTDVVHARRTSTSLRCAQRHGLKGYMSLYPPMFASPAKVMTTSTIPGKIRWPPDTKASRHALGSGHIGATSPRDLPGTDEKS